MSKFVKEDPTKNVLHLLEKSIKRIDDLRDMDNKNITYLIGLERDRVNEVMNIRSDYESKLIAAEAKRIDAIRAVDVNAVMIASQKAEAVAAVLANQVNTSAETLRSLVATTASVNAQQLANLTTNLTDRISSLEKSQYEISGKGGGMKDMGAWIFAGFMALVTIANIIYGFINK